MLIELLAKSCVYEESIDDFINKLMTVGFSYPKIPIVTMHESKADTAINQLSKLFTLKRRTEIEKQIIFCFRLLPEGERVSRREFEMWLGFSVREVDQLIKEGWINFKGGFFGSSINTAIHYF